MQFAQAFFYISVGLGVWIVVIAVVILIIESISTVKLFKQTVMDVRHGIADLENLKQGIKLGVLSLLGNIIGNVTKKGGGKSAK